MVQWCSSWMIPANERTFNPRIVPDPMLFRRYVVRFRGGEYREEVAR